MTQATSTSGSKKPPFDDSTEEGGLLCEFLEQSRTVTRRITDMVEDLLSEEAWNWEVPVSPVVTALERHVRKHGLSDRLRRSLADLQALPQKFGWITIPKAVRARLDDLLQAEPSSS